MKKLILCFVSLIGFITKSCSEMLLKQFQNATFSQARGNAKLTYVSLRTETRKQISNNAPLSICIAHEIFR